MKSCVAALVLCALIIFYIINTKPLIVYDERGKLRHYKVAIVIICLLVTWIIVGMTYRPMEFDSGVSRLDQPIESLNV